MVALAAVLGGCAGYTYEATPIPAYSSIGDEVGSSARGPSTAESRAEAVVDLTAETCMQRSSLCEEEDRDALSGMLWSYPDVQVPSATWRFPTSQDQEVVSVGLTGLVSLSEQTASVDRGNTLYYPGNQDP